MDPQKEDRKSQKMIRSSIRMLIPTEKHSEVFDMLMSVCAQAQFDPSCISSHLYMGVDEVRAVLIEEFWKSHEELLCHLQSDVYRRVLLAVEMAQEAPEICFDEISRTCGIELIENALKQGKIT